MKAIQLEKPLHFRQINLAEPDPPQAGQALVRVHRVGICGSDYSGYLGKMPFYSYPRIPGHELGVEVIAVGSEVTNVKAGDRCAVEPYINCEQCSSCRRGNSNCCEALQVLGVHTDGGLRPFFLMPARKLHPSKKLTLEQLALVETLAIGCHAVNRANPQPGETALVIGAGPIGLATLEFVKVSGAKPVVFDLSAARLEFCQQRLGVENVVQIKGDGAELSLLIELAGGSLPTVVIDATGSNKSMGNALNYTGFTGRLVYVGLTTQEVSFPHSLMHRRELTLLASRNALPHEFRRIIQLIEEGRIDTRPWITHQASFDQMIDHFPNWLKPETGVIKAIVSVT
jgi:2-desacetyl-2-hydroxyethyl bacteriochlorophyllide A dehydrogenase